MEFSHFDLHYLYSSTIDDEVNTEGGDINEEKKLDAVTFCKLFDIFGEEAAGDTLNDVNDGRVRASTIEKYLYTDETKEEYSQQLKEEYEDFE